MVENLRKRQELVNKVTDLSILRDKWINRMSNNSTQIYRMYRQTLYNGKSPHEKGCPFSDMIYGKQWGFTLRHTKVQSTSYVQL